MDTASYSFSACSDGSVSYTITCTGQDCDPLGDLFGSICSSSGDTVTCLYKNCTGSIDYVSTSQFFASNSTFYAVNDLSIKDCADVSFIVNGTSVLKLAVLYKRFEFYHVDFSSIDIYQLCSIKRHKQQLSGRFNCSVKPRCYVLAPFIIDSNYATKLGLQFSHC
ncbi:unnamed protein product [Sphagnum balticum]